MTAEELAYRAAMNDMGLNAMMNIDEMMRNVIGLTTFETMQNINDIVEKTAYHSALGPMQSALEKLEVTQTSLERTMNPPSLVAMHAAFEMDVNSPRLMAMRNDDRVFAGLISDSFKDASNLISCLEGTKEMASLKNSLGELATTSIGSSINNGLFAGSAAESPIGEVMKSTELVGTSFYGDLKKDFLRLAVESPGEEWLKRAAGFAGISSKEGSIKNFLGESIVSSKVDWTNCVTGSAMASFENGLAKNLVEEMDVKRLPELIMIKPYKFKLPDLPYLPPISREVTLSPETIEMLAEKIAEKGGRIEITATHKSMVIMGNASNNLINTGDKGSDKKL